MQPPWLSTLLAQRLKWWAETHPNVYADNLVPIPDKYRDDTTNDLTHAAIDWFKFHWCAVARTNTTGAPRKINGEMILTPTKRGGSDIDVVHEGRVIKCEIKCKATGDTLKDHQFKEYLRITKAGGLYIVVPDMPTLAHWWQRYTQSLQSGTYPLHPDGSPIQPVITPPRHRTPKGDVIPSEIPTLDQWRQSDEGKAAKQSALARKAPKPSLSENIEYARFGTAPPYVKHSGENRRSMEDLERAKRCFEFQGYKVLMLQQPTENDPNGKAIYYRMKGEVKEYKRLPVGHTRIGDYIYKDGKLVEDIKINPDGGYTTTIHQAEQFCIPAFIISRGDEVYVVDTKFNVSDYKIDHYVRLVKWMMQAKGGTRKVLGGVCDFPGGFVNSRHRVFTII